MALAQEKEAPKQYTIEDIYALGDGKRAELLDGRIYFMAPPSVRHQEISAYLHNEIYNYIKSKKGKCRAYAAPFAVFLEKDGRTYVEPDLSVICDPNKLDDKGCHGAPDWVIEIVSPASRTMDYYRKLIRYSAAGVREYWIVDPEKERTMVYNFEKEMTGEYPFSEPAPAGIYEDLTIQLDEI